MRRIHTRRFKIHIHNKKTKRELARFLFSDNSSVKFFALRCRNFEMLGKKFVVDVCVS